MTEPRNRFWTRTVVRDWARFVLADQNGPISLADALSVTYVLQNAVDLGAAPLRGQVEVVDATRGLVTLLDPPPGVYAAAFEIRHRDGSLQTVLAEVRYLKAIYDAT